MLQACFLVAASMAAAVPRVQEELPVLKATRSVVSVQEGERLRKDSWRLAPEVKPDVYEAEVKDGKPVKVTFSSDVDSISFLVEEGARHDFVIQHGDDRC